VAADEAVVGPALRADRDRVEEAAVACEGLEVGHSVLGDLPALAREDVGGLDLAAPWGDGGFLIAPDRPVGGVHLRQFRSMSLEPAAP